MKRLSVLSVIIAIVLIIGTGGVVFSQTTAVPNLTGYFVGINGNAFGPYDTTVLRQLISTGQLTRNSLVWKEGMANWAAASTVKELEPLFPPAMPPPLPAAPPLQQQQAAPPPQQAALPQQEAPPQQAVPPQQAASADGPKEPWGGSPAVAGLVNSAFGIWSWTNSDIFGGVMTTLLEAGGIAVIYVGIVAGINQGGKGGADTVLITYSAGAAMAVGGIVFGVVRGVTQYNKKMALYRSFTEAISGNPLNNISMVAYPTAEKRIAGSLTYSLLF